MCPAEETSPGNELRPRHERSHQLHGDASPASASWAARLRRGDPAAVAEVRKRVAKILAYGPLSIPPQEREDLEQEVMTDVWKAMNRADFDLSGGFWGFVEVVTSRRCIDWLRARRESLPLVPDLPSKRDSPFQNRLKSERERLAAAVLAALDPVCQKVITLRYRDDLSYAEISRVLGRSEGALRVQMYRCLRYGRKTLARLVEAGEQP